MSLKQIILLVSIIGMSACNSEETQKNKQPTAASENSAEPAGRIQEFYSAYISERAKAEEDTGKINNLFREYCTASFVKHLETVYAHGELEADPVIDAQDVDQGWIKTLSVQKNGRDNYQVCYVDSYNNQKHCLDVEVVNENGQWKINNIVSNM